MPTVAIKSVDPSGPGLRRGPVLHAVLGEGWKASFVMDNLLDRDYCDFADWSDYTGAYYYPACGRSFMFALGYSF